MRLSKFALLAALALVGCAKGNALVVVTVTSNAPLQGIADFDIAATAAGKHAKIQFGPAMSAKLPHTLSPSEHFDFGVQVPAEDVGEFQIVVIAKDSMGRALKTGIGMTATSPGSTSDVTVTLGVEDLGDGGTDASGDGATCPTTCEEAGVGCGTVTTSCGTMLTCPKPCGVHAIEPAVSRVGDTITLEGRFGTSTTVNFSGNVTAAATLLGPSRASVLVPTGAITGPVTVSVGGATSFEGADLKVVSFAPGLTGWANRYPQTDAARIMPQLAVDRGMHAVLALGHVVLALGGTDGNMGPSSAPLNSFESADINADGTLQKFILWATSGPGARTLVTARAGLNAVKVAGSVIALGGWNNGASGTVTVYNTVEHADINGDGTGIQSFTTSQVTMTSPRYLAAAKVIGDYLYVFGGFTGGSVYDGTAIPTATVERARILQFGGNLGPFEQLSNQLTTPRGGLGVEIIGNTVYVMGGLGTGSATLKSIEKATINGDGSLGPFSDAGMLDDVHAAFDSIVMGGKIYLIGGVGTVAGPMPDNAATVVSAQIGANDSLGTFSPEPARMTRARAAFGHGAIVGNNYYVFGGGNGGGPTNVFDVEATSINASGDIGPFANYSQSTAAHRTAPGAVVFRDHLYLFGGQTAAALQTIESAPIAADGSLGAFTQLNTMMNTARSGPGIAVLNNQIYVYGGGTGTLTGEVFQVMQDGTLQSNAGFVPPLTSGRMNMQMVAVANPGGGGGYLYAIGGDGSMGTDATMERAAFDPSGNLMGNFVAVSGTPLIRPHSNCSGALIGDSYYLFGEFNAMNAETDVSLLDSMGGLGNFGSALKGTLTHSRWNATAQVIGSHLLLFGGNQFVAGTPAADASVDSVPILLNSTGAVQLGDAFTNLSASSLVRGRRAPVSAAVGNYVYVMNGYDSTDSNSVEQAPLK